MNVIGEIGNFIIKYQEPLQAGAILVLAIAAVVIIVKLFANAKKKREILNELNQTVSEINKTVNHLSEKKAEVIYIDSRMSQGAESPVKVQTEAVQSQEAEPAEETEVCEDAAAAAETAKSEPTDATIEKIEPSLKYFSRDCAISKTGKKFTVEELEAQIKD